MKNDREREMPDETYEGWENRETWALALWLNNDEGLYNTCIETARNYTNMFELAEEFKRYVTEDLKVVAKESKDFCNMFDDIGNLSAVNWEEISKNFKEGE